jgi:hypothetical protein
MYWNTDSSVSLYQKVPVRYGTFVQHLSTVTPPYTSVAVKFCISIVLSSNAFKFRHTYKRFNIMLPYPSYKGSILKSSASSVILILRPAQLIVTNNVDAE